MKKVKMIVRNKLVGVEKDEELRALNGFYVTPYEEFDDNVSDIEMLEFFIQKYSEKYSHMRVYQEQLVVEEDKNNG